MKKYTEKRTYKKGSLTIEAALVLPIFMFAMICVISLSALLLFQIRLKEAMHEEVKKAVENSTNKAEYSVEVMEKNILDYVGEKVINLSPIEGNVNFTSDYSNGEIISIDASYDAKLYYDFTGIFKHSFTQRCLQHDFNGYDKGLYAGSSSEEKEQYVYITANSEVYHKNRECTHIRLKISEISAEALENARNSDGAKYKSCEHCHSKLTDGQLYITADGDKYHNSLGCSGLKRNVIAIPISEVGGRRCCQRCGG